MKTRIHCGFCYALFTPPGEWRAPSTACDRCYLEIAASMSQPEQDFTPENAGRINYQPESWVIQ